MIMEVETRGKSCTTCIYCCVANKGTECEVAICTCGNACYDDLDDVLKEKDDE